MHRAEKKYANDGVPYHPTSHVPADSEKKCFSGLVNNELTSVILHLMAIFALSRKDTLATVR